MFYLKYRPQRIAELDLKNVRERLSRVLAQEETPHAFLFSGPRGAGKTSAARIVAKAVNCERRLYRRGNAEQKEPCDSCAACIAIREGRHLDIIEIDAASNRGIDQIRELRDKIGLSPASAKYKIYIIDEVHMLTKEAFNALLKTLEEPPAHVIFILATTEARRLPQTVRSRCIEFIFQKAAPQEIVRSLRRVAKGEKIQIDEATMLQIARLADGSFRDATKILEEIASTGEAITVHSLEKYLGTSFGMVERFIALLARKKSKELLEFINCSVSEGTDVFWLTKAALDELHDCFLHKYALVNRNQKAKKANLRFTLSEAELIRLMRLLEQAAREAKNAVVEQLPLELAVLEFCHGTNV